MLSKDIRHHRICAEYSNSDLQLAIDRAFKHMQQTGPGDIHNRATAQYLMLLEEEKRRATVTFLIATTENSI